MKELDAGAVEKAAAIYKLNPAAAEAAGTPSQLYAVWSAALEALKPEGE